MQTPREAYKSGDVEGVKKLLEACSSPHTKDRYRPNSVSDKEWASVKEYLMTHPNEAMALQKFAQVVTENPMKLNQSCDVMAMAETMKNN